MSKGQKRTVVVEKEQYSLATSWRKSERSIVKRMKCGFEMADVWFIEEGYGWMEYKCINPSAVVSHPTYLQTRW